MAWWQRRHYLGAFRCPLASAVCQGQHTIRLLMAVLLSVNRHLCYQHWQECWLRAQLTELLEVYEWAVMPSNFARLVNKWRRCRWRDGNGVIIWTDAEIQGEWMLSQFLSSHSPYSQRYSMWPSYSVCVAELWLNRCVGRIQWPPAQTLGDI